MSGRARPGEDPKLGMLIICTGGSEAWRNPPKQVVRGYAQQVLQLASKGMCVYVPAQLLASTSA
eukprot:1160109-Pelagomonas_calceolata.AAC.5